MTQDASCGWVHMRMSLWQGANTESPAHTCTFVPSGVKRLHVSAFTCTMSLRVSVVWGLTSVKSCEVNCSFLRNLKAMMLLEESSTWRSRGGAMSVARAEGSGRGWRTTVMVKHRRRNKPLGTRASAWPVDVVRGREPLALPRGASPGRALSRGQGQGSGLTCCQQNCCWRGCSLGTPRSGLTSQAVFTLPCRGVSGWFRSALSAGELRVRSSLLDLRFPLLDVK